MPLTVLSCGIDPQPNNARFTSWGEWADQVYGSAKLLALDESFSKKGKPLGADARSKMETALRASRKGKNILVLASGDALFHGVGGTIQSLAEYRDEITYLPAETAFQALFHKLGMAWDTARVFSAHFCTAMEIPFGEILSCTLPVIYGGSKFTAADLARLCVKWLPASASRDAIIAEELGTDKEKILKGPLADLAKKSVSATSILVLLPSEETKSSPVLSLGRENDFYEKENNLITGEEVRAIILSKLRLPAWGLLWDIGAGSGSIGLEAASLRPRLRVLGMEKNPDRAPIIQKNRERLACPNYLLFQGEAPDQLGLFPRPDRIFIGGGGEKLTDILSACFDSLKPGGILVASAVTLESKHALYDWHPERRSEYLEISISKEQNIAGKYHHLKQQNSISLFTFTKA